MARLSNGPWYRKAKDTWYVWHDGRQHSLGVKGKANRTAAVAAWHRLMAGGAPGPAAPPQPAARAVHVNAPAPAPTVRELADLFLADAEARLKRSTVETYRHDVDEFAASLGAVRADRITPVDVTLWLARLKVGDTTKAIRLRSVSACFGWAVRMGILADSPVKRVSRPKARSRSEEAVISEDEHARLMKAATPEFRTVLAVLHGTGARPGEVCGITSDTFDPASGVVRLTEHKSDRTGRTRLIVLPPDVCELLRAQLARWKSGPLLRSRVGRPYTARTITKGMQHLQQKTGVRAFAYGYRHTFATDALSNGVPDSHVASLLGHTSTAMIHKHYSHLGSRLDVLREAASKVRA